VYTIKFCAFLLLLLTAQSVLTGFTCPGSVVWDNKLGIGPAWNQLYAQEHFTLNAQDNQQAKTIVIALDNPCVSLEGKSRVTFDEQFYAKGTIRGVFGSKGAFTFNQSTQVAPFDVISNLDGLLTTIFFDWSLVGGIQTSVCNDRVVLSLGGGWFYIHGKRPITYIRDSKVILYDTLNTPIVELGCAVHPTQDTTVSATYTAGLGWFSAHLDRCEFNDSIHYHFNKLFATTLILDGSYRVTDCCSVYLGATWIISFNTQNGRVSNPPSLAALFSNDVLYLFRAEYSIIALGLKFEF